MAKTLTASISASISWTHTNAIDGSQNIVDSNSFSYAKSITSGTGAAGTADLVYHVVSTLAGAGTTELDVAGTLTDQFGATITMARIKYLWVSHTTDTTATHITVGNAVAPVSLFSAATTTITVRNGEIFLKGGTGATGIAVSAGTTDDILFTNADASNSATVQIAIIGSSA
jgi:hypothetical protein